MLEKIRIAKYVRSFPIAWLFFVTSLVYAEGTVDGLWEYKYWDSGKLRSCIVYDKEGKLRVKSYHRQDGTAEKIERYDVSGNKIEEGLYDEKGRLRTGIDGWALMRWWYDGLHLVAQVSYDETGKPIARRQYSEGGSLVAAQFRNDGTVDPYEEANIRMILSAKNK